MIRKQIEEREKRALSPYATLAVNTKGRAINEPPDPIRLVSCGIGTELFILKHFAV